MAADPDENLPSVPGSPEGMPSWAGVGGALAHDADTSPPPSDEDGVDAEDASSEDRIAGVVAQTRADVGDQDKDRVAEVLHQRLTEAGLEVDADRTAALAAEITSR